MKMEFETSVSLAKTALLLGVIVLSALSALLRIENEVAPGTNWLTAVPIVRSPAVIVIPPAVTVNPPESTVSAPPTVIPPESSFEPVTRELKASLMVVKLVFTGLDSIMESAVKELMVPIWATATCPS